LPKTEKGKDLNLVLLQKVRRLHRSDKKKGNPADDRHGKKPILKTVREMKGAG